ncbi:unnamed protein product [Amoebophrya sp. A25]|nr:unnamed protein product [Amoebophrya sp. A25]|eukprot:GSA25T00014673001.1
MIHPMKFPIERSMNNRFPLHPLIVTFPIDIRPPRVPTPKNDEESANNHHGDHYMNPAPGIRTRIGSLNLELRTYYVISQIEVDLMLYSMQFLQVLENIDFLIKR